MDTITDLTFRNPLVLSLFAGIPLALVFLVWRDRRRRSLANRFASERIRGVLNPGRRIRPVMVVVGLALAVGALAGPRYGFTMRTIPGL